MPRKGIKVVKNAGKARTRDEGYEPVVHKEGVEASVEQTPGVVEALGVIADKLAALVAAVQEHTRVVRFGQEVPEAVAPKRPARGERADPPKPAAPPAPPPEPAKPDAWGEPTLETLKRMALAAVADVGVLRVQAGLQAAGLKPRISELREEQYPAAKALLLALLEGGA